MVVPRQRLVQLFRMRGLSLRPEALSIVTETISPCEQPLEVAKLILEEVRKETVPNGVVDARRVQAAINVLRDRGDGREPTGRVFEVIDALAAPKLAFDAARRAFSAVGVKRVMHAGADAQRDVFASRLQMLRQRLLRDRHFRRPALEHLASGADYLQLTDVEALAGSTSVQCVLGLLSEPVEGVYHLEDLSGLVPVDLSGAHVTSGLFTLGCVVLCEGEINPNGVFEVKVLAFPPPEPRESTRVAYDGINAFGGAATSTAEREELQRSAGDAMMIVVSDCWLDRDDVLAGLEQLLDGYEAVGAEESEVFAGHLVAASLVFVLCGNFTAEPIAGREMSTLPKLFTKLAEMIRRRPALAQHAHFVLVPGPHDALLGPPEVLPRSALPRAFAQPLVDKVPNVHLASSPARVRFFGREAVIFRDDLVSHMRRNAVVEPNLTDTSNIGEHLVKTIIDQAHVRPTLQSEYPVYWAFDHSLQLPCAPDALVLADSYPNYKLAYAGCEAFNPGNFLAELSWMVYRPETNDVEYSSLN